MRLALGLALAFSISAAQAASPTCLNIREVEGFNYKSAKETVARTNDSRRYLISFAGRCGYNRFEQRLSFNQDPSGVCLERGNTLRSYDGSACIISKITELPPTG
jgi:hypothetical protein